VKKQYKTWMNAIGFVILIPIMATGCLRGSDSGNVYSDMAGSAIVELSKDGYITLRLVNSVAQMDKADVAKSFQNPQQYTQSVFKKGIAGYPADGKTFVAKTPLVIAIDYQVKSNSGAMFHCQLQTPLGETQPLTCQEVANPNQAEASSGTDVLKAACAAWSPGSEVNDPSGQQCVTPRRSCKMDPSTTLEDFLASCFPTSEICATNGYQPIDQRLCLCTKNGQEVQAHSFRSISDFYNACR